MRYISAFLLSLPIGALLLFEISYLYFGITGKDATNVIGALMCLLSFGFVFIYPLHGTERTSEAVKRSCSLGIFVAISLPFTAFAVLLLFQHHPDQGEYGMGGLIIYGLPIMTAGVGLVVAVLFLIGRIFAVRHINNHHVSAQGTEH